MKKTKEMLKNEIIAEMIIRRTRNDNAKYKLVYYIIFFIVVGLFLVILNHNNTSINNLINK